MSETPPDILLRGKKIRRKYTKRQNGTTYTPTVRLLVYPTSEHYDHPEIEIRWGSRYGARVTMRFQANRTDRPDGFGEMSGTRTRSHGFLALAFPRSGSYGGQISGPLDAAKEIEWTLALVREAQSAFYAALIRQPGDGYRLRPQAAKLSHDDDSVLAIVIGLQRLGIDVAISNPVIREKRAQRRSARLAAAERPVPSAAWTAGLAS